MYIICSTRKSIVIYIILLRICTCVCLYVSVRVRILVSLCPRRHMSVLEHEIDPASDELDSKGGRTRSSKMTADQRNQALFVHDEVEDFFETYSLEEQTTEEDLSQFLANVGDLKKRFRKVHVLLKESDKNFIKNYPQYDITLDRLKTEFKNAEMSLKELRKGKQESLKTEEEARRAFETSLKEKEEARREQEIVGKRLQAISEWEDEETQIRWFLGTFNWECCVDLDNVQDNITHLQNRLFGLSKFSSGIKGVFGNDTRGEKYLHDHETLKIVLQENISKGIAQKNRIKSDFARAEQVIANREALLKEEAERKRTEDAEKLETEKIGAMMVCARNMRYEIKTRYDTLRGKFKIDFDSLGDFEILDIKKKEDSLGTELRELLDKISALIQYTVPCGVTADALRNEVIIIRDDIKSETDEFLETLNDIIANRDISEKKLKNSSGLEIPIPKFKGYQSELSIYTFRSEFKKLVEPQVQKPLLARYLKNKLLVGPAHSLVLNIEDIDEIWEKLIEVYGNTEMLLQTKLGSLSKFSNLSKLQDDEKISLILTNILNTMSELSKLATENDLESELYYGGGLEKVFELIGKERERKFIRSTSKLKLRKNEKWDKLVEFLKEELLEREAYVLNEKSKQCLRLEVKHKNEDKDSDSKKERESGKDSVSKNDQKSYTSSSETIAKPNCFVCGKHEDHVLSLDSKKNPYIEYVACKEFVDKKKQGKGQLFVS